MSTQDLWVKEPITLKCGLTLPNRLVKAAMAEHEAGSDMLPSGKHIRSYATWSEGGWGMVMTGNVQVDPQHLGGKGDVSFNEAVSYEEQLAAWTRWAETCNRQGTPTIVQINHPGRQSTPGAGTRGLFAKTVSSSATPLRPGNGILPSIIGALIFGTPREMTTQDIRKLVDGFARMAKLSAEAGFAGAEIHAAHGYLLDQFLSPNVNRRSDDYGIGAAGKGAKVVVEIIEAMRAVVPAGFCIGIKLNSVDHQSPEELALCIEQLRLITAAGVDFLEISGGTYENPKMMSSAAVAEKTQSARTRAREAFFLEFAATIRHQFPDTPLMVTGGFRSRNAMNAALEAGDCDLIGIARPAVLDPHLPKRTILNPKVADDAAVVRTEKIKPPKFIEALGLKSMLSAVTAGAETMWYGARIRELGQ